MSGYIKCNCGRKKGDKSSLRILRLNCNYSHFESPKGARHSSKWSLVVCINDGCRGAFRTKNIEGISLITEEEKKEYYKSNN